MDSKTIVLSTLKKAFGTLFAFSFLHEQAV